jgi:predicted RNA binding protein YcfA (HicA-like mRNA interferase family)
MKYSELKKLLRNSGCEIHREGKRHEIWYSPKTDKYFSVGRHDKQEVANGTLNSILKEAGLK